MKWVKRITTSIIFIILILLIASTKAEAREYLSQEAVEIYDYQYGNNYYARNIGYSSSKPMYPFNTPMAYGYTNAYCLHKGKDLGGGSEHRLIVMYETTAKVVIDGDTAKFYTFRKSTKKFDVLEGTITNNSNNVLACILQNTKVDGRKGFVTSKYTYGVSTDGASNDAYSDAQLGIYKYLNTWIGAMVDSSGTNIAKECGFSEYSYSTTIGNNVLTQAQTLAKKYNYKVTLYLFTYGGYQPILTAHYDEDPEPRGVEIPVKKVWVDSNNKFDTRPDSITVKLYANGNVCKDEKGNERKITLPDSNGKWEGSFENLPETDSSGNAITYAVKEETTFPGYTTTITGDQKNGYTITNRYRPNYVEITGNVWEDIPSTKDNTINGTLGSEDKMLDEIPVTLVDKNGNAMLTTKTANGGVYTFQVKIEDDATLSNLEQSYVRFEYNGMQYTTVAYVAEGENKSKAQEDEGTRINMDNAYSKVTSGTNKVTTHNITASTQNIINLNPNNKHMATETRGSDSYRMFKEVNLGLFERETPDVSIESNLDEVEVTMNGQKYTYFYNKVIIDTTKAEVQAQFQNKQSYTYRRPVNPADIAYLQETASDNALSMYVTYSVKVTNEANSLVSQISSIINSYDKNYTLVNVTKDGADITANVAKTNLYGQPETEFSEITIGNLGIQLQAKTSATIKIKYQVNRDAIIGLLNKDATISNAVEIGDYTTLYSGTTLYAEQRTGGRNNQAYGGFDKDSHPGNAAIDVKEVAYTYVDDNGNKTTYENEKVLIAGKLEDDTDIAPSLLLCKDDPKTLSGTIWEDLDIRDNEERVGNGKIDSNEKAVGNVKIELYNLDGTPATLYDNTGNKKEGGAVVYSRPDGKYSIEGVVTGEYFIKFTYGNDETKMGEGKSTTIAGATPVNARNYKSTIITDAKIKEILKKNYGDEDFDKKWHINHESGYSVAVDNMKERLKIEDLINANFDKGESMVAYTKPFVTLVEFEGNGTSDVNGDGDISGVNHELTKLDFGISERPREDLFVEKTITYISVTLSNGQALISGNPLEESLQYGKVMGLRQNFTSGAQARAGLEKQMLIEMDTQLIQGSTLDVKYLVRVTNNNEIDYDYGTEADYADIVDGTVIGEYITKSPNASYYYYGDSTGLEQMKTTLEIVDYMDREITYDEDNIQWNVKTQPEIHNLYNDGLLSESVYKAAKNNKYKVLIPTVNSITLERKGSTEFTMSGTKVLANKDENAYDNNLEIIKIDGKTARTIQESKDGEQITKTYKPGNYVPSTASGTFEQDDDRAKVVITPPTGRIGHIVAYTITGLVGLIVMVVGIVFIKRKILEK